MTHWNYTIGAICHTVVTKPQSIPAETKKKLLVHGGMLYFRR